MSITGVDATIARIKLAVADENTKVLRLRAEILTKELANATPIDTGEAMRGWVTSIINGKVTITNSVPHIAILNQGHSQQAPAYFVERILLQNGRAVGTLVKTTPG